MDLVMESVIDLLKPYGFGQKDFKILEDLVKLAIFNSEEEIRKTARKAIEQKYQGLIAEGIVGDNQVMLVIKPKNSPPKIGYFFDAPKEYDGMPSVAHNFRIP